MFIEKSERSLHMHVKSPSEAEDASSLSPIKTDDNSSPGAGEKGTTPKPSKKQDHDAFDKEEETRC